MESRSGTQDGQHRRCEQGYLKSVWLLWRPWTSQKNVNTKIDKGDWLVELSDALHYLHGDKVNEQLLTVTHIFDDREQTRSNINQNRCHAIRIQDRHAILRWCPLNWRSWIVLRKILLVELGKFISGRVKRTWNETAVQAFNDAAGLIK